MAAVRVEKAVGRNIMSTLQDSQKKTKKDKNDANILKFWQVDFFEFLGEFG